MIIVAALYQFKAFENYREIQPQLLDVCKKEGVFGALLLGAEGINGTISGLREGIDIVKAYLVNTLGFQNLEYKESFAEEHPFYRMKVKLKKEIVTLGVPSVDPVNQRGAYVSTQEWNQLIADPDTVVIDTRNDYEYKVGTFKNALNPKTDQFSDFPKYVEEHKDEWKGKKIAMFCTGGIRCEKSTSYMKSLGFDDVYHLKGGILQYLEDLPEEKSLWEGSCFVFDHRVAVNHGLELSDYTSCGSCREPVSVEDRTSDLFEEGVSCPQCYGKRTPHQLKRSKDRQRQIQLAKERGRVHLGDVRVR